MDSTFSVHPQLGFTLMGLRQVVPWTWLAMSGSGAEIKTPIRTLWRTKAMISECYVAAPGLQAPTTAVQPSAVGLAPIAASSILGFVCAAYLISTYIRPIARNPSCIRSSTGSAESPTLRFGGMCMFQAL